jgi:cytochrome c oxidase subunit 1
MTMFRLPMFTWTVLVTSLMVLIVFPVLAAALFGLGGDRRFGMHIFDPEAGGVDALATPVLVLRTSGGLHHRVAVLRHHQRDRPGLLAQAAVRVLSMVIATIAIAALSIAVWAHHMYATGQVLLPFFAIMTMLIAVPTGVKFFNWIGTMWGGSLTLSAAR